MLKLPWETLDPLSFLDFPSISRKSGSIWKRMLRTSEFFVFLFDVEAETENETETETHAWIRLITKDDDCDDVCYPVGKYFILLFVFRFWFCGLLFAFFSLFLTKNYIMWAEQNNRFLIVGPGFLMNFIKTQFIQIFILSECGNEWIWDVSGLTLGGPFCSDSKDFPNWI